MCSICSGRSEHFFAKDKVLISPNTCLDAVSKCENFFFRLSKLRTVLPEVNQVILKTKPSKDTLEKLIKLQDSLTKYSPPAELVEAFAAYDQSAGDATARHHKASAICSMIMNVRKAPYIMVMNHESVDAIAQQVIEQAERNFNAQHQRIGVEKDEA